jgi:predicted phosphodiesterase
MSKAAIARAYRSKFPNTPSLTLAKRIYKDNPEVFKDVEDARAKLRYIEGKSGACNLSNKVKESAFFKEEARPNNPFRLPDSSAEEKKPFLLPKSCNNVLIISDLHIPYHDISAITAAFNYGIAQQVNTVFINGDLIDFYQLSRFEKDPRARSLSYELDSAKLFLDALRSAFPDADIYYIKGNHCMRLESYLRVKAPELLGVQEFTLEALLQCNKYKVKVLDDKLLVKIGKLSITHGHHVIRGIFAPVNSARGTYLRAKQSTMISHVHKVSEHTETDMDGNMVTCWSTGCLAQLKPDYSPLVSNYSHGFAHVIVDEKGHFNVKNYRIHQGKIL